MKHVNYKIVLFALTMVVGQFAAAQGGFIKTQREDFSAMIADGVESEKQLREELRRSSGLEHLNGAKQPASAKKRTVLFKGAAEQIAVPSHGAAISQVKKTKMPTFSELAQKRVSQEIESIEH